MTQGVQKQVRTLPAIETELHLFQVSGSSLALALCRVPILSDVLSERPTLCVLSMEEAQIAVALADSDYHFVVIHPA